MARPTKCKDIPRAFFTAIASGDSLRGACRTYGIAYSTANDWLGKVRRGETQDESYIDFYKCYSDAVKRSKAKLLRDIREPSTIVSTKTKVDADGSETIETREETRTNKSALAKWLLERRWAEDFSLNHLEPEVIEDEITEQSVFDALLFDDEQSERIAELEALLEEHGIELPTSSDSESTEPDDS